MLALYWQTLRMKYMLNVTTGRGYTQVSNHSRGQVGYSTRTGTEYGYLCTWVWVLAFLGTGVCVPGRCPWVWYRCILNTLCILGIYPKCTREYPGMDSVRPVPNPSVEHLRSRWRWGDGVAKHGCHVLAPSARRAFLALRSTRHDRYDRIMGIGTNRMVLCYYNSVAWWYIIQDGLISLSLWHPTL